MGTNKLPAELSEPEGNTKVIHSLNYARLRLSLIAASICFCLLAVPNLFARPSATFDILASFDYPGSTSTSTRGINQGGDVSGFYYDSAGAVHGYIRFS